MLFLSVLFHAHAKPMITFAKIVKSQSALEEVDTDDFHVRLRWPFCPSYPDNMCTTRMWVDIEIHIDGYVQRRNASHESWYEIIQQTQKDVVPLSNALQNYYTQEGISDMATKAGIVHGMIKAVHYAYDNCDARRDDSECKPEDSIGWTEYPKYGLEFLVDQKGDCEDAAIITSTLFENIGIESWLVNWNSNIKGRGGHASTALTLPQGNLGDVSIPSGSKYIYAPKTGAKLLSADSVGAICEGNCFLSPLGTNEWENHNLFVSNVFRTNDKSIDDFYSGAWKRDGSTFTKFKRDRRKDTRQEIQQELDENKKKWDEQTRKRLSKLKEDPDKIQTVIASVRPYKNPAQDGWVFLIILTSSLLGMAGYGLFERRRRRKRKAAQIRQELEKQKF